MKQLLTTTQAAKRLGLTRRRFLRFADQIPLAFARNEGARVGMVAKGDTRKNNGCGWGHRRYWSSDVDKWAEQQKQTKPAKQNKSEKRPRTQKPNKPNKTSDNVLEWECDEWD